MARRLRLGISPCPNDTFAFHHLASRGGYDVVLDDIEALNVRAERGDVDLCKISVAAYPRLREEWMLLRSGGAAGYGVGPLLVGRTSGGPGGPSPAARAMGPKGPVEIPGECATAARAMGPKGPVAIPGERTTAALLLTMLGTFETVPMRFDRIEQAVLSGEVEQGVLIHEGRFSYAGKGLVLIADLGEVWERRMHAPLPLGAVAIRRALGGEVARRVDEEIRASVAHAIAHPEASASFVREHAQEMAPEVVRRHIALYVNEYTLSLDERAIDAMLSLFPPGRGDVFVPR